MADAQEPTTASPPVAGETFSKEYVDELKAQLARQQEKSSVLEARQAAEDTRRRETLKELQPTVMEFMKDAMEDESLAPYKHEMGPMTAFAEGLHEANSLDTAVPLARTIACFSNKYKRKVEEFAQTSEASELLAKANKELDEVKADRDAKAQRVSELEGLADERLKAAEDLQAELAKIGGIKEKYDFSKLGSREVSNASGMDKKDAPSRSVPADHASVDPLLAFVGQSGAGGLRMQSSGTSHHLLGNVTGGTSEADIAAAIRMA